jgi:hypothetical protein
MAKTKGNEWNFAANAAQEMTKLLALPEFATSDLGRVEPERSLTGSPKRPDLVFFHRTDVERAVVTGELKAPWTKEGKTPFDSDLVEGAHAKAVKVGAHYFVTWNIKRVVVWRTDDPGKALDERAVYDKEIIPGAWRSGEDLTTPAFKLAFEKGIRVFLTDLSAIVAGRLGVSYLPLDRLFVARLESMLDHVDDRLVLTLIEEMEKKAFASRLEQWMRSQSWIVSDQTRDENAERAVRFSSYVLLNRMCFYNALRRKYPQLPVLKVSNANRKGEQLKARLGEFFDRAREVTGDYQTVFELTEADNIPFLSDECVPEWRDIIARLDKYDFASIPLEVIGAMYEQLIRPEERHRYGQHYTQPTVVDLINSFSVRSGKDVVLDPSCGGGTFLVRAYNRKRFLDGSQTHDQLLTRLYGCDILSYACHLSVINLAVRDLVDDNNFPQIHLGDFMDVEPEETFCTHPVGIIAGGLEYKVKNVTLDEESVDAVVGNPPYINAKLIPGDRKRHYLQKFEGEYAYDWDSGSDILIWFWVHSLKFLKKGGRLSLITQAAWIDVEYGFPLQRWILDHFKILAVMESEKEPWFSDARVATVVIILQEESDPKARAENSVRFIQFKQPLWNMMGGETEADRHARADALRDRILAAAGNLSNTEYRLRIVSQDALRREGENAGGEYVGGKWGRHLRALDCVYDLSRGGSFCPLSELATVERGSTTNCDDFFIVRDVSDEQLEANETAAKFKSLYGAERGDVEQGRLRVVDRDGVRFILPRDNLSPILKTAREVFERSTSQIDNEHRAVVITGDRPNLTKWEEKYVKAGEKEGWHLGPSFNGRADWYKLRDIASSPIYFVKTIQYAPQLLWNDSGVLPNQRLYGVDPVKGVDAEVLAAALSSTLFAAERFAGAKALGREAANDIEVFTARKMLVFDVRKLAAADAASMKAAFRRLRQRPVGPVLEAALTEGGLASAQAYVDATPLTPNVLPAELLDPDRREIDRIILRSLGLPAKRIEPFLCELHVELTGYQRKSKLLELHAQVNRRGTGSGSRITATALADEIIGELVSEGFGLREVPDDFYADAGKTEVVAIPAAGRAVPEEEDLFTNGGFAIRFGKAEHVAFKSERKRDLALLLAQLGIRGDVTLPVTDKACGAILGELQTFLDTLRANIEERSQRISDDEELRVKVTNAAIRAAIRRHTD